MNKQERVKSLMPNGRPRYIRCYDNGGTTCDRYTVVFTGHYRKLEDRYVDDFICLSMDDQPFHPQGFCQHGYSQNVIDRPSYSHLGKPIKFDDLPLDCQKVVTEEYKAIWGLEDEK